MEARFIISENRPTAVGLPALTAGSRIFRLPTTKIVSAQRKQISALGFEIGGSSALCYVRVNRAGTAIERIF